MKKIIGDNGEDIASKYLIKKGYKVIARNYRAKYGEIDIIASYKKDIVFIEVKTRTNNNFGEGFEAVTKSKQDKIIKTAAFYISENKLVDIIFRFDIISIDDGKINHIENAFTLE